MNNNPATTVEKLLEFIFQLFEMKYKPAIRIKDVFNRTPNDEPEESRKAKKLLRRISSQFPLDAIPLSWGEVGQFKDALHNFALEIFQIIGEQENSPYSLARCTLRFVVKWNKLVESMEDKFLFGFGQIKSSELEISTRDPKNMIEFFTKMRKAQRVPCQLACLHSKVNQKAITSSIEAYFKLIENQTLKRTMRRV